MAIDPWGYASTAPTTQAQAPLRAKQDTPARPGGFDAMLRANLGQETYAASKLRDNSTPSTTTATSTPGANGLSNFVRASVVLPESTQESAAQPQGRAQTQNREQEPAAGQQQALPQGRIQAAKAYAEARAREQAQAQGQAPSQTQAQAQAQGQTPSQTQAQGQGQTPSQAQARVDHIRTPGLLNQAQGQTPSQTQAQRQAQGQALGQSKAQGLARNQVQAQAQTPSQDMPQSPKGGLTTEEESVLRAVAAIQAPRVKTPSQRPATEDKALNVSKTAPTLDSPPSEVAKAAAEAERLAKTAATQVGKRYVMGGTSPRSGFDCSGFTNWVYGENGVDIARSSREQYQEGTPVARDNLQKGDLVFFGSKKRVNHVGMYLGDGQFIHSTSSGGTVRVNSLDEPVWSKSYAGARRVLS